MNKIRLQQLRRVVTDAPEDLFDMRRVSGATKCGTAHCAYGWMKIDPWFLKNVKPHLRWSLEHSGLPSSTQLAKMFGVTAEDAEHLFASYILATGPSDVSKAEVLWNIDELLAGRPARAYKAAVNSYYGTRPLTVPHPESQGQ